MYIYICYKDIFICMYMWRRWRRRWLSRQRCRCCLVWRWRALRTRGHSASWVSLARSTPPLKLVSSACVLLCSLYMNRLFWYNFGLFLGRICGFAYRRLLYGRESPAARNKYCGGQRERQWGKQWGGQRGGGGGGGKWCRGGRRYRWGARRGATNGVD